jgi:hypothetical protein
MAAFVALIGLAVALDWALNLQGKTQQGTRGRRHG